MSAVADLASAALANERRIALTYAEARRDALTGLANKRAFDELLGGLRRRRPTDGPVSLVLFDLDGFKRANDEQGHAVGDEILREAGRVFLRVVRSEDEIFRVGGDEFALVVDGAVEPGRRVADRLRIAVGQQRRGHRLPTVSAGVATIPDHAGSAVDLQRKADIALYAAKLAGKNRVQTFNGERGGGRPPAALRLVSDPARGQRGLRLLVVDDDPALRILLRTTFEVVDIEVEEADSADLARSGSPCDLRTSSCST